MCHEERLQQVYDLSSQLNKFYEQAANSSDEVIRSPEGLRLRYNYSRVRPHNHVLLTKCVGHPPTHLVIYSAEGCFEADLL